MRRLLLVWILFAFCALGVSTRPALATTPTPQASTGEAHFFGKVNMAEGLALPEGLEVVLEAYDMDSGLVWNGRAPVGADGSFDFGAVPVAENHIFAAFVVYGGVDFLADQGPLGMKDDAVQPGDEVELSFTLYDTTTDSSVLEATRLHIIIEPIAPGKAQVSLWYMINNPSARAVVSESGKPVLRFSVPTGGTALTFSEMTDASTLVSTEGGFGDTASVQPGGSYQMFYTVEMSYQGQVDFVLPLHMRVGQAIVMLPEGTLEVSGEAMTDGGHRTLTDGSELQVYTSAPLEAGDTLRFRFGEPPQVSTALIGGLALGSVLLAVGGWWLMAGRKRRAAEKSAAAQPAQAETPAQKMDELLDSIVALDDLYHSGEIAESAYLQRRAELKERVRQLKEQHG